MFVKHAIKIVIFLQMPFSLLAVESKGVSKSDLFGYGSWIISIIAIVVSVYLAYQVSQMAKENIIKSINEKRYYHLNDLFGQYISIMDNLFQKDMRILNGDYINPLENDFESSMEKRLLEFHERSNIGKTHATLYRQIVLFGIGRGNKTGQLEGYFSKSANFFNDQSNLISSGKLTKDHLGECMNNYNQIVMPIQNTMKEILENEWEKITEDKKAPINTDTIHIIIAYIVFLVFFVLIKTI